MKSVEVQYGRSSIFREKTEQLVDLIQLMVPEKHYLKHISIDVDPKKVTMFFEEDKDVQSG
jgi:hypothetical protein